jgi:hypothetical protein
VTARPISTAKHLLRAWRLLSANRSTRGGEGPIPIAVMSVHVCADHFSLCEAKGDLETYVLRRRFGTAEQAARRIAGFRQQSGGSLNVNYPIWPDPRCAPGAAMEARRRAVTRSSRRTLW